MNAFDTDILTEYLLGTAGYVERVQVVADWAVPVVVAQEIIEGRLKAVRLAEQGKGRIDLETAYSYFSGTLDALRTWTILPYTSAAQSVFEEWRKQKLGKPHDLRIAAICLTHSATLVTRNRQDFAQIPGLVADFWN